MCASDKGDIMDYEIVLVGLNHRTAQVNVRERFALVHHTDPENLSLIHI